MYVKAFFFPDDSSFHCILSDSGDIQRGMEFDTEGTLTSYLTGDDCIQRIWHITKDKTRNFTVKEFGPTCR